MIPVLMITYNRLEYTKNALSSLLNSRHTIPYVIDNGSTDGTREYLLGLKHGFDIPVTFFHKNVGIAGAMNHFFEATKGDNFVGKVDNDTIVPKDWAIKLRQKCIDYNIDIIQAKHLLDPKVTNGKTFDEWMQTKKRESKDSSVYYNHFVGGSGIIFRRNVMKTIPETEWKLYGWRQFQRENPQLKKAFCTDVEIELLDGGGRYEDYPEYYKETRRC